LFYKNKKAVILKIFYEGRKWGDVEKQGAVR